MTDEKKAWICTGNLTVEEIAFARAANKMRVDDRDMGWVDPDWLAEHRKRLGTAAPRPSKGTHGDSCECYSCWHKRKSAKRVCLECDGDGVIGRTLERCESCAGSGLSLAGPVRIHQCEFLGCALPKGHSGVHAESNALTHEQILAMDQRAQAVLLGATYFDDPRPSDLTPEQEIDRLVAARTGPGRPMVQRPNEAPTRPSCASCAGPAPGKYCTSCVMSGRASAHDRQELTDEIERLRVVIKTGGAMYRAERLALECGMGGMPPDEPPPGKWTEENGRHYCYECSIKLGKRPNEVTPTSPSLEKEATLECGHCGGVAITSPNGWFWDGAGGRCLECGHPGHVSCDGEEPPYWHVHEGALDFCAAHDCDECNERRRDLIVEPARRTQDTQYSEGDWIDLRCRCCKSHPLMRGWKFCPDCGNGIRAELRENAKGFV